MSNWINKSQLENFVEKEELRQKNVINLIASENYASQRVLKLSASRFSDKYAEGSPGKRFYTGCSVVDKLEAYGQELANEVFGSQYSNLQPHSGANANWIAYFSVLNPGDTVVAMDMRAGGHLTHGFERSLTSKVFNFVHYGVDSKTFRIDYNKVEELVRASHPKLLVAGASSYPFEIDWQQMAEIAHQNGALFMADIAHLAGLIGAKTIPSPFPYADLVTCTTQKTLRGPRGGIIFSKAELSNKVSRTIMPGFQGGPNIASMAAKIAAIEECQTDQFKTYCEKILQNTQTLAQAFEDLGIELVGGGSENHLLLIDVVQNFGLSAEEAEKSLEEVGILVNRNFIPGDSKICSGIRIGTPAMTTRQMSKDDWQKTAWLIFNCFKKTIGQELIKEEVLEIAQRCLIKS